MSARPETGVGDRPVASDAVACGPLWCSPEEMCEVRVRGRAVPMSMGARRMLAALLHQEGRVLSREQLSLVAGGRRADPRSRSVDVQIFRIRRALGSLGAFIVAVPGRGYRADVTGLARSR